MDPASIRSGKQRASPIANNPEDFGLGAWANERPSTILTRSDIEQEFKSHNRDPADFEEFYFNKLFEQILRGDMSSLNLIGLFRVDVNMISRRHGSLLSCAARVGYTDMVRLLLDAGADVNLQFPCGDYGSALTAACAGGEMESVKLLLDHGADVNLQLTSGIYGSALAAASHNDNLEAVKLLITNGAVVDLQLKNGEFGSALAAAANKADLRIINLLLQAGANPALPLYSGPYGDAVSKAIHGGSSELIQIFLQRGASLGPMGKVLLRRKVYESKKLAENLTYMGVEVETFDSTSLQQTIFWELPAVLWELPAVRWKPLAVLSDVKDRKTWLFDYGTSAALSDVRDKNTWLFDYGTLIRKVDTVEFDTLHCFLERSYGDLGPRVLQGLARVSSDQGGFMPNVEQVSSCRGLELGFKSMLGLSAVEYPVLVNSGIILMGYSTALVPIRETEDGRILWHLEIAQDDFQIKVANLEATQYEWLQTESLDYLQSKKALLGWCSRAQILLGTDRLSPTVTWSSARNKPITWKWKGANLQGVFQTASPVQIGLQAGGSFERTTNSLRFDPSAMYLKCLRNSAVEQIILYDVREKRAWMVPLLSVLHHMLLVYTHSVEKDSLVSNAPKADLRASSPLASLNALRNKGNMVIEGSGIHTLTVAQLIMKFSINMGRLSPQKPKRSTIYGYEFMDIVMDSTRSELKKEHLEKEGLAWSSLLGEINCLFCSGLGEAIFGDRARNTSSACNILPKGNDFLAASMQSIERLSMRHGGSDQMDIRRLSHDHFWQLNGTPFKKCDHETHQGSCWRSPEFLQEIQTRKSSSRSNDQIVYHYAHGALVFGSSVNSRPADQASVPLAFLQGNPARGNTRVFQPPRVNNV
ncbi:uncharacterized protein N7498_010068 [Penicillium cinerascens]|uniref:Uncharacterized protein n=1 Tax=Penicillium cinerascens TaxID=70096 RepID=A0A9W9J5R0_9EURO|nr:uncharacterized protein N7498_010068 [Penicillium cinerascens]KAJ5191083.1 hypothetical protein N7498_010068 [Penicillium cinerascens]